MKDDQRDKLLERLKKKAAAGGRAACINWKCAECIYDPDALGAGSWRKQVSLCTSLTCPLYKYRPCTIDGKSNDEEE